jgi:hypothetical protein
MGLGFRKSFKVAPGVRLNVSSKGLGVSAGVKGLRYSVNSRSGSRVTAGIPGTGVYYTSSGGRKRKTSSYRRYDELAARQKEIQKLNELEAAKLAVESYENTIERIHSIHKEADDEINWHAIKNSIPPFQKRMGEMGERERIAVQNINNYKPGFMSKLFGSQGKDLAKLQQEVQEAKRADEEDYNSWERDISVAARVLAGDTDTYFQVIEEFAPLDDLAEFGSGFEFFSDSPNVMEVEFDVHSEKVVPNDQLSLTPTGKLSRRKMAKGKYYDIQQDYVCSCVLRIARDMFALLPLDTVYIHAMDQQLNPATGHLEKSVILSVRIDKNTLNRLNLDQIDCSDSMQNFVHNMKFKKTAGFVAVERLPVQN